MGSALLTALLIGAVAPEPGTASPTEQFLLERLDRLEERISELEAQNRTLEKELAGKTPSAVGLQQTPPHSQASAPAGFTIRPHFVFQDDVALFFTHRGGYDFNDGTAIRHASIWVDGDFGRFSYQLVLDFPGGTVVVPDAWLRYNFSPSLWVKAGQQKAPFGFQYSNNDNFDIFIERSMFGNAAAAVGSGRRLGLSATYQDERFTLAGGVFGDNDAIGRSTAAPLTNSPDESWGFDARAAWRPILRPGLSVHVGVSAYHRRSLRAGDISDAVRVTDRPNVRVDGGNIADSGVVENVSSLDYLGTEFVVLKGRLMLSGEYGVLWLRRPDDPDVRFSGHYLLSSYFLTGGRHQLVRGSLARLRPLKAVGKGGIGALEFTLRHDSIDLSDTPVPENRGNRAQTFTAGLNWYLNPYLKVLVNWIRINGRHSPLDPVGDRVRADAIATRLHVDM